MGFSLRRTGILSCAHYFQAMWDLKCTERDDEIGKSSKASIKSRKSIKTEQAMLTVIVLITLPTNIVIIFVRIILMWNNNDEDYDHVDAGNQERAELGKELYSIPTLGLTFA